MVETGALERQPEKNAVKLTISGEQCTLSGPVLGPRIAKLRRFLAFCKETQADFSARQTVWRREWNSNPNYPFHTECKLRICEREADEAD